MVRNKLDGRAVTLSMTETKMTPREAGERLAQVLRELAEQCPEFGAGPEGGTFYVWDKKGYFGEITEDNQLLTWRTEQADWEQVRDQIPG